MPDNQSTTPEQETSSASEPAKRATSRTPKADKGDIPSGLSYVNSYGVLQKILAKIIEAPAPERITQDFLGNVWGFTGGSAMAAIPFLKKIDFLSSDGVPTDYFRQFRTDGGRNSAIRHALRSGFPDIYRQTDFAENAKDDKIADVVVGLTGRSKSDGTVRAILETFKVIKNFINNSAEENVEEISPQESTPQFQPATSAEKAPYNLSYQINIVLPETKDIEVFDAIFRKLKEHLL